MELAAIASAAVPGLAPTGVAGAPDDTADFDSALLVDAAGKQWRVRSPRHAEASMRLETELQALRAFTPAVKAELPFLIPHMAGSMRQGELSTFVYSHLPGSTRSLEALTAGGTALAQELGRAIAAIHDVPEDVVHRADLPSYEAGEYRRRKLNELDQAATTGKIPSILLRRWEHALEDVTLWRFSPTVVHGDLHEDHFLVTKARVSAVTGWTDLCIGDPAEDFAWLAAAEDLSFVETVYDAYAEARTTAVDPHLNRRAALAAEFALAQWLVRGVALEDATMVREAEEMLATLEEDVEYIEQEHRDAIERARRAEEERRDWGNAQGTDEFRFRARPPQPGVPPGISLSSGRSEVLTGESTIGTPVDDAAVAPPAAQETAQGAGGPSSSRKGSSPYVPEGGPDPDADNDDDNDADIDTDRTADDAAPAGSSAYTRLMASRPGPAQDPSSVTLLRTGPTGAGNPDDVATSALPVVKFGRSSN